MAQQIIQHTPSTNIANIVYDPETQTLVISFLKGGVCEYYGVPEDVVNGFGTALSATKYLNSYVENQFPSQRVA